MAGTVIIPWYATGFRGEDFEAALNKVAATSLRYNASSYAVYRARDDRYKFQQLASFAEHLDWERYWHGPEMTDFRIIHSSWYQVPVLYGWWDLTTTGGTANELVANGNGHGASNGHAGNGAPISEGESA